MKQVHIAPLTADGGRLTGFFHDPAAVPRGPRPAILVCPGGGYRKFVTREGDPVALSFYKGLDPSSQEKVIAYIQSTDTGETAKARTHQAVDCLGRGALGVLD